MENPSEQTAPSLPQRVSEDYGIGAVMSDQPAARLINRDGSFNVQRNRKALVDHLNYATLLNLSWPAFFGWVVVAFLTINLLFCGLYLACGRGALSLGGPALGLGRGWQAFVFSVDTFSTIGYGNIIPVGHAANLLVALEALTSLLNAALVTGLVFARFSRPNVRIQFSNLGVIRLKDKPAVLLRLRNLTRSEVLEVEATLLAWFRDPHDHKVRHFHALPLERSKVTFLPLSWTVAHFITPESPFHGMTEETFQQSFGEVMLQIRGTDQSTSQSVYARVSYTAAELQWSARYADQYTHDPHTGVLGINEERFHQAVQE